MTEMFTYSILEYIYIYIIFFYNINSKYLLLIFNIININYLVFIGYFIYI
jgi:hypothetical protein